jgi:hypothetical protein
MFLAVLAARYALLQTDVQPALRLAVEVSIGAAVYVPCWMWRAGDAFAELKTFRRRTRRPAATLALEPPA